MSSTGDVRHTSVEEVENAVDESILVVEDESAIAELISINLRNAGYEVTIAATADRHRAWSTACCRSGAARLDAAGQSGLHLATLRTKGDARIADNHAERRATKRRQDNGLTPAPTTT